VGGKRVRVGVLRGFGMRARALVRGVEAILCEGWFGRGGFEGSGGSGGSGSSAVELAILSAKVRR
jgi:hypothetical protein